ncbi:hypothetical protein NGB36_12075 [Streptomyces sp. RB6PN25]|uniref:N-acetyltransferase domain-containing protein n=1 Tax=Streptomyces humicola TaxID=2953240 RepID=A0ABT1PUG0_9ACTN|nr:hypothetical protein [Streptomyces humicola]MCQ4081318.1 hypothetical protein [Streptomyces humicola]
MSRTVQALGVDPRRAEDEASARGCRAAVLYTITFQVPGFYRKRGWKHLGEVPCDTPGTSRVFMTKELAESLKLADTAQPSLSQDILAVADAPDCPDGLVKAQRGLIAVKQESKLLASLPAGSPSASMPVKRR